MDDGRRHFGMNQHGCRAGARSGSATGTTRRLTITAVELNNSKPSDWSGSPSQSWYRRTQQ